MKAWLEQFTFDGQYFRFASPWLLLALLALPVIYMLLQLRESRTGATLRLPNVALLRAALGGRYRPASRRLVSFLRVLALALLVLALARPQWGKVERQTFADGIDIMLVLDTSLSMQSPDLVPNRLEAAKKVMSDFISGRRGDRIGLTIFGTTAAAIVPMTLDYNVVQQILERITFQLVDGQRTAIGSGLATGLSKLRDSKAKSKVIVLLTDGVNNAGDVNPLTAAEAAKTLGVKIYPIGVGSGSRGILGMRDADIDEESLTQIADMTGGKFFRATDNESLSKIYAEIDRLEKSDIEATQFDNFNELGPMLMLLSGLIIMLEIVLRSTRFVRVP